MPSLNGWVGCPCTNLDLNGIISGTQALHMIPTDV